MTHPDPSAAPILVEGRTARTIGVAVPIPEPYAGQLHRWRKELGDPLADAVPAHITLLPPTLVPVDADQELEDHLIGVAAGVGPFDVHLDGSGTFRPTSPVVFVAVGTGADACAQLETRVRSGPLGRETSFPYHPHVTVAHHLDDATMDRGLAELAGYSASFRVDAFCLYGHGEDGVWRPERCFLLGRRQVVPV